MSSFVGDSHPVFHGNVVKAIASGFRTYPKIVEALAEKSIALGDEAEYQDFAQSMQASFDATLLSIERQDDRSLRLIIKAPAAAKQYSPGQFFRVQNFETLAVKVKNTLLQTEAVALAATHADLDAGTVHIICF